MNHKFATIGLLALLCLSFIAPATAQDENSLTVSSPYDSLSVSNVKAVGMAKTGEVTISVDIENKYAKQAKVHFSLGGYSDLGIEDDKGNKYKIHTSERLIGTQDINKGYKKISSVFFGEKKMGSFTYVEQELGTGDTKTFTIKLAQFNKSSKKITDLHVRCILFLNYMHVGDKMIKINEVPIEWK